MRKLVALYIGSRYASLRSRNFLVGFISLLTVGGLALGVAILVTVLSVMNGFDREMQQRILGLVPHLTVTTPRLNFLRSEAEWKDTRAIIDNTPGVLGTAPYMQLQGMLIGEIPCNHFERAVCEPYGDIMFCSKLKCTTCMVIVFMGNHNTRQSTRINIQACKSRKCFFQSKTTVQH